MRLQLLVSALEQDVDNIAAKMNISSDAIIINQCDAYGYKEYQRDGYLIKCYSMTDRGVGISRNEALMRGDGDIVLFSDDDIVYDEGYAAKVIEGFEKHPEADMLLFNIRVNADRKTYYNDSYGKVWLHNCGRYPAYSFAVRNNRLKASGITFNTMFGGGCRYANGEDSLFIRNCIKKGLKVYKIPVEIGEEKDERGGSTWFHGYNEKFFHDRGVLYHFLYGRMAKLWACRFLIAHGRTMCHDIKRLEAYNYMKQGIANAKNNYGKV